MSCCEVVLTGQRMEHCTRCCQTFTGQSAGDMHRVGDHAVSVGPNRRRCLTVEEMEARGMARNGRGHWMTRERTTDTPQIALPQGPRIDAQDHPGVVAHCEDSRPSEQYDSE